MQSVADIQKLTYSALVLAMLFSTGEVVPLQYYGEFSMLALLLFVITKALAAVTASTKGMCAVYCEMVSQWSSGSIPDCSVRGPGIELRCGQLCLSHNHCDTALGTSCVHLSCSA